MWGVLDSSTDQRLHVDGHVLSLRANLASCLRAYREHLHAGRIKGNLPLWIDLICIQQDCIEEKNHQVQQMGAIYEQARSVLVWLGPNTKVDILDCFQGDRLAGPRIGMTSILSTSTRPPNVAELRLLFRSLLNQHWTRTWILQELCLAKSIAIFTEKLVFRSKVLDQIQTQVGWVDESYSWGWQPSTDYPNPHTTAMELFNRFSKIWSVRDSRRDSRWKPLSLCSTISQLGRDSDCSHHRDKVFAFLQMCSPNADIVVDYEADEALMFCDVLGSVKIEELGFSEVDCLREVLQLTWLRLLRSTMSVRLHPRIPDILLPCYLDCGTLSVKVSRKRLPWRSCRQRTETYNAWFQTDSTSTETMFRIVSDHVQDRSYKVTELYFCPSQSEMLYGNLLASPVSLQVLNEEWNIRWETVAVGPCLFMLLCFISSLDQDDFQHTLQEAFPDATGTLDRYVKQRSASKKYGMRLE